MAGETFAPALIAARRAAGHSQARLGRMIGVTAGNISRLEARDRFPSRQTVDAIAALDVFPWHVKIDLYQRAGYVPTPLWESMVWQEPNPER